MPKHVPVRGSEAGTFPVSPFPEFFLHFFQLIFAKTNGPSKKLQKYKSTAVGHGDSGPTFVPHGVSYSTVRGCTVATATAVAQGGSGPICFQNFVIFCLNSDGDKLYMKIVAFDEIYNFVVQSFSI
jgi:hypothetical protein